MARPILLQDDFSGGMKPDLPITQLPKNAVRNMEDLVPWAGEAPLSARNGWERTGSSMATTYASAVAFAPFAGGGQLIGIADTGAVFQVPHTSATANTARGSVSGVPQQPPVFYRDKLYIPSNVGNFAVRSYDGSSNVAAITGSAPMGVLCTVFKDHLVLARDMTSYRRIWFSAGGDATVWDTAADGQWLDASHDVTGLAVVRNMILAFQEAGVERIRGDIIPGVAGSDMVREPLPIPGCADPASIAVANDVCYYTNATGIYMTDGIGSVDLTDQGGIKNWWNNLLGGYDGGWTIAGGVFSGKYIVSVHDGGTFKLCLVCDVARRAFYQFTNVPAVMFASSAEGHASSTAGALFMAERDAPWLAKASTMFGRRSQADDVIGGDYADGNGSARNARLRTGYFQPGGAGRKRFKKVYAKLGMDADVTVEYHAYTMPSIYSGGETDVGSITSASILTSPRKKISLSRATEGVSLELHAELATTKRLDLYKLEVEAQLGETSRG
jgi:hypothetical protein